MLKGRESPNKLNASLMMHPIISFLHDFEPGHKYILEYIAMMTMFGHMLPILQCSATCCPDDNSRPHVARMMLQKLTNLEYKSLTHQSYSPVSHSPTTIFQTSGHFFLFKKHSVPKEK